MSFYVRRSRLANLLCAGRDALPLSPSRSYTQGVATLKKKKTVRTTLHKMHLVDPLERLQNTPDIRAKIMGKTRREEWGVERQWEGKWKRGGREVEA